MTSSEDRTGPHSDDAETEGKRITVPLSGYELSSLRLKMHEGESEVDAVKRIISESFETDAIEAALSKFMEVLERLIVLQRKLNWLGIDSDEEYERKVRELTESVMSVSSLKKRLERRWRS